MSLVAEALIYPIMFVIVISVVIVIHELGHYWAGRHFGAAVESFSMGFGKSIFERTDKNNTRWRVNWLPLGGFVSFVDEGGLIENEGDPQSEAERINARPAGTAPIGRPFTELSPGARNVVALAGPFANFVLAILIFGLIGMFLGDPVQRITVATVGEDSAASQAGVQEGDIFLTVNGRTADRQRVILEEIKMSAGDPVQLEMQRGQDVIDLTVTPKRITRENVLGIKERTGMIGVRLVSEMVDRNHLNPVAAVGYGVSQTVSTISSSLEMLARIVTGRESLQQLSGPVGIANVAGNMAKTTLAIEDIGIGQKLYALFIQSVHLIAFISVAVGFFNLIPLPILDGGVVVINTYEAVTGKGLSEELLLKTKFATLLFLAVLAVFITVGDFEEAGLLELFNGL
tara:strand:- start:14169 stop:15371 length:1203 start_codon:yes stop_codon:yes gene_type:complete